MSALGRRCTVLADLRKDADHLGFGLADVSVRWSCGGSARCWPLTWCFHDDPGRSCWQRRSLYRPDTTKGRSVGGTAPLSVQVAKNRSVGWILGVVSSGLEYTLGG